MKKLITFVSLILLFTIIVLSGISKVISLKDQVSPFYLRVDKKHLYISDGPTISIYDLNGFQLLKKFGKKGEGPGEFIVSPTQNLGSILFDILDNKIIVQSIGKISYFSTEGDFIKEVRSRQFGLKPIGEDFVGYGSSTGNNRDPKLTINLFDKDLNIKKELHREKAFYFEKPSISPFDFRSSLFMVYKDLIILERGKNRIDILKKNGKHITSILPKVPKIKISEDDKKQFIRSLKLIPQLKSFVSIILKRLKFPEFYPKISMFDVADNKIFIITNIESNKGRRILVYNLRGAHIGSHYIKNYFNHMFLPKPYTFGNNNFYQIEENLSTELNDLYITRLKTIK